MLHAKFMLLADYGNAFTGAEFSEIIPVDESITRSICNELLEAAGELHHICTDVDDGVQGLGVSTQPAATPANTFASSSIAAGKSESSRMNKSLFPSAVWSIHRAAASAHMPLTEAAWQAVWNWQATPGNGTQQLADMWAALLCLLLPRS